ncbi:glycosyltransferase family 4 protein [Sphingomonas sp. 1185]|uniref:glycosyltransferase family 4 protein n=1 Tax=Sphingomonas sp. 1185 TaxID=3156411 RepID=UPI0033957EC2
MASEHGPARAAPRVLHVCDSIIGGTGSYLAELLTPQAKLYGPAQLMLLMPRQHIPDLEPRLIDSGISLVYFHRPNRLLGMVMLFFAYLACLRRYRPDIVHAHSFGAGVCTRIVPWFRRHRLVFCPHGWAFNMPVSAWIRRAITLVERILAMRVDRILLISQHERQSAEQAGMPVRKLVTIPNAIATEPPPVAAVSWQDTRIKLLFVGRFDRQKGLDLLLDAIRPLGAKYSVRVVGRRVVGNGVDLGEPLDFVDFVGWRDRDEVSAEMKAADAVIVPSRWEGFGLVAIEAMRLGRPVIASDAGGLNDILDHGRYGFSFPAGDVQALRTLLTNLDKDQLPSFGEIGRKRFLAEYSADRMVGQVDDVYRDLMTK